MENMKELWDRARTICLAMIQSEEEKGILSRNLSMVKTLTKEGDVFTFHTTSAFAIKQLQGDVAKLRNCLNLAGAGNDIKIEFEVDETAKPKIDMSVTATPPPKVPEPVVKKTTTTFNSPMPLNPEYTFEEFVRGPSNSIANATAISIASKPGRNSYNPFFIHGGTGLGKTHLMQAIGNEIKAKDPSLAVCYLTAEVFMNEYVNALQNSGAGMPSFRTKYRNVDVFLVDDIQFIAQRKQMQEEFFNTFTTLYAAGKQIVLTSDVSPKKLQNFEDRLISRFEGGMVQEIELPSYETRLAILRKKAEGMTPKIPDNALKFIAENIKTHVRAMEGALGKVNIMLKITPTMNLSDEVLVKLLADFIERERNLKKITIEEIQNKICHHYQVTMAQLLSPERTQSIVTPRQLAMYISKKYTNKSLPEVAKMFDKTHATIIHGVKTITKRLDVEPELRASFEQIINELGCSPNDKID